jgi:hypothetical protein
LSDHRVPKEPRYVAGVVRYRDNGYWEITGGDSILWEDRGIVVLVAIAIALLVAAVAVGAGVFHP